MENQIINSVSNVVADQAKQVATTTAQGIFERIFSAYNSFVGMFPDQFQWVVSLVIVLAVASFLFNLIKKNWLWLILLVVIFPGILPILKNVFDSLTAMLTGKPLT